MESDGTGWYSIAVAVTWPSVILTRSSRGACPEPPPDTLLGWETSWTETTWRERGLPFVEIFETQTLFLKYRPTSRESSDGNSTFASDVYETRASMIDDIPSKCTRQHTQPRSAHFIAVEGTK